MENLNNSTDSKFIIGDEVVRSKGDYVVGRVGKVIEIDYIKCRARVDWESADKSWVSFSSIESTAIPYEIIPSYQKDRYTWTNPKYKKI